MDFTVLVNHRVEIKENEKTLPENWKKLWNMKMAVIPVALREWSPKAWSRGWKSWKSVDELRPSKTTVLRSARISRRVLEICRHSDSSERPSAIAGVKNLQGIIMMIIIIKFDHTTKWYIRKPESILENETHKILWAFWDTNRSPNSGQKTRLRDQEQKKRISHLLEFVVLTDHRVKIKK